MVLSQTGHLSPYQKAVFVALTGGATLSSVKVKIGDAGDYSEMFDISLESVGTQRIWSGALITPISAHYDRIVFHWTDEERMSKRSLPNIPSYFYLENILGDVKQAAALAFRAIEKYDQEYFSHGPDRVHLYYSDVEGGWLNSFDEPKTECGSFCEESIDE